MLNKPLDDVKISVIVITHNMKREAKRTLYSLTTEYQQNISEEDYEVIVVDSNSSEALDDELVRSCGSQFKYLNVWWEHPSPCYAINKGVENASNQIVMCIIDGARILSPNILSKTRIAFNKFINPFVYTIGMHIGPKVQNESILDGYNKYVEDKLLNESKWKDDGYNLFAISSVALSSKEGFYSELSESNCFSIYKDTYNKLGGFNEKFISPGGGLINLDFFNRAMACNKITPVMLLGEATFHQIHGGVATNVPLKQHPWKSFEEEYKKINNKNYHPVYRKPCYFGSVPHQAKYLAKRQLIKKINRIFTMNWK